MLRACAALNNRMRAGGKSTPSTVILFLIAAVVVGVCLQAVNNGFVDLDDVTYVAKKPVSDGLTLDGLAFAFTSLSPYWHPLTWLSHELDAELFGASPAGHHFISVLLHALTAGLLYLVFTRLGARAWQASAGALLWALHPLRVESFAWVAERKDVLCALFFVAAVAAYLRYQRAPRRGGYALWCLCGALALMSKPTAVSLPAVLLLLDLWPGRRNAAPWRLIAEKAPLAAVAALVMVLTIIGQTRDGATRLVANLSFGARLANAVVSYARYLGKLCWPLNLACHYPYQRALPLSCILLSAIVLIAVTVIAIAQWRIRPWLAISWAWFVVTLLPNAGLVQAGRQAMADRFTLIPTMGITLGIVWAVSEWAEGRPTRRRVVAGATALALAAFASLTVRQIGFWHDSETLFGHAIAVADSGYMRANLATILMEQARYSEAEPHLMAAIRMEPSESGYHQDLALLLFRTGRWDQAAPESQAAVALAPRDPTIREFAGLVALRRGQYKEALATVDEAIGLGAAPGRIAASFNDYGAALASQGSPREAEPLLRRAVQLDPALVQAHRNLALTLLDLGRSEDANAALRDAVAATGDRPEYRDLGSTTAGTRR